MMEKSQILLTILGLLLLFYLVIAWGSKTKVKSPAYPAIKNYMFGVRVLILILSIVSFILWLFL